MRGDVVHDGKSQRGHRVAGATERKTKSTRAIHAQSESAAEDLGQLLHKASGRLWIVGVNDVTGEVIFDG